MIVCVVVGILIGVLALYFMLPSSKDSYIDERGYYVHNRACENDKAEKHPPLTPQKYDEPVRPAIHVDEALVERMLFIFTIVRNLGSAKNVHLKDNRENGCFIRVCADDFNGKSWAELSGAVYNLLWERETRALLQKLLEEKSLENARAFLLAEHITTVTPEDLYRLVRLSDISIESEMVKFRYGGTVPNGMGRVYYETMLKRLREKYPYTNFECDPQYGQIDYS